MRQGERPPAPSAQLPILGGSATASLSDYRGQIVVLGFWGSWCAPCAEVAREISAAGAELRSGGEGTGLLVSSLDDAKGAQRFVERHGLDLPVLEDRDGRLVSRYGTAPPSARDGSTGTMAFPSTFVLDREGRIVAVKRGGPLGTFLSEAVEKARNSQR